MSYIIFSTRGQTYLHAILNPNLSLSGKFPEKWKLSSVVPIPKASDRASPSNYRPISFSTSCCKQMLERHFHHFIANYLSEHHPLVNTQWGFQSGKGTVTALLSTAHDCFTHLEALSFLICRKHLTLCHIEHLLLNSNN